MGQLEALFPKMSGSDILGENRKEILYGGKETRKFFSRLALLT
jgi:hypothetical protein